MPRFASRYHLPAQLRSCLTFEPITASVNHPQMQTTRIRITHTCGSDLRAVAQPYLHLDDCRNCATGVHPNDDKAKDGRARASGIPDPVSCVHVLLILAIPRRLISSIPEWTSRRNIRPGYLGMRTMTAINRSNSTKARSMLLGTYRR